MQVYLLGLMSLFCLACSPSSSNGNQNILNTHQSNHQSPVHTMKIGLKTQQHIFTASLANNATARDFYRALPLTLKLSDYAHSEKIATNIPKLSIADAPKGYAGKQGDLTYYAPWGNLAIFYQDSHVGYANGLVYLGKIDGDIGLLTDGEVLIDKLTD